MLGPMKHLTGTCVPRVPFNLYMRLPSPFLPRACMCICPVNGFTDAKLTGTCLPPPAHLTGIQHTYLYPWPICLVPFNRYLPGPMHHLTNTGLGPCAIQLVHAWTCDQINRYMPGPVTNLTGTWLYPFHILNP